jgi:hypothetical protein
MDGFWTDEVENTADAVKYKAVGKFDAKVLVWCLISEAGVASPFIGIVKLSSCGRLYYQMSAQMVKFIEKLHKNDEIKENFGMVGAEKHRPDDDERRSNKATQNR